MSANQRVTSFQRDGLTFDVLDAGPLDGEPVVLLHGFPQRATAWAKVAPLLHAAGLRTFAPDQRGYSPGARPRERSAYTQDELVDDVLALIDLIGRPAHLVGHDFGANVAWSTAGLHPDRVASLTAVSVGHPRAFGKAMRTSAQKYRSLYMLAFQLPVAPELALRGRLGRLAARATDMSPEMVGRFRREIVADGALTGGLNWYRAVRSSRLRVPEIEVPTTFVWSDGDPALGRTQAELTEQYVVGPYQFLELAGASHWIPEERPEELARAILSHTR